MLKSPHPNSFSPMIEHRTRCHSMYATTTDNSWEGRAEPPQDYTEAMWLDEQYWTLKTHSSPYHVSPMDFCGEHKHKKSVSSIPLVPYVWMETFDPKKKMCKTLCWLSQINPWNNGRWKMSNVALKVTVYLRDLTHAFMSRPLICMGQLSKNFSSQKIKPTGPILAGQST